MFVFQSGGDLENAEQLAAKFAQIVHDATRIPFSSNRRESFKKISGNHKAANIHHN